MSRSGGCMSEGNVSADENFGFSTRERRELASIYFHWTLGRLWAI
jgi:hypothetical protein